MSRSNMHLLDLPDEILVIILRKLNNIDVLFSLLDINNERLAILAQDKIFTSVLNFVDITDISLIDRCCMDILPRIHHHVKSMIVEPVCMERVLLAAVYPNLTELKLFNFDQQIALKYFTDESSLRSIFQQRITNLILVNNDRMESISQVQDYTKNVYANILNFFKNLKHLTVIGQHVPGLSLHNLPSTTFHSSILTHLSINMSTFDDCFCLLDGRLQRLTTLNVIVDDMRTSSTIAHDLDKLPNLKSFSFKSVLIYRQYEHMLSLLRRMSCLESLTLNVYIRSENRIFDGTCLQNDILVYMPQLHSFTFHVSTQSENRNLSNYLSRENIQQTLLNIRQHNAACIVNYNSSYFATCSIFSVPFAFDSLRYVGNIFPNIVFSYVTLLRISDNVPFQHEFFVRIGRSFPLLKYLHICNFSPQLLVDHLILSSDQSQSYSMVKYPHLSSLDVAHCHEDYVEQFLNETKASVPLLTELTVHQSHLQIVTKNFTREATRRNCAKVKRLKIREPLDNNSEDYSHYFPSLLNVSLYSFID